jgi:hypothetical protein
MRRLAWISALALLAACASPLRRGRAAYFDAVSHFPHDPPAAREDFAEAEQDLAEALADPDLPLRSRVEAASLRIRALLELDRHAEAADLAARPIEGYSPEASYDGDRVGLALLRAHALGGERGYAELVLAERYARTDRARLHLAWQQVRLLERIGTPKAKAEAVRICAQYAGKLDFDEIRKRLEEGGG